MSVTATKAEDFNYISQHIFQILKNKEGNMTLVGLLITLSALTFSLQFFMNSLNNHQQIKQRTKTYLCAKYLITNETKYLSQMAHLNILIRGAYYAQFIPKLAVQAKALHKGLIQVQNLKFVSHTKNLTTNSYCSFKQSLSFATNRPYWSQGLLLSNRHNDGTARVRRNKWKTVVIPRKLKIQETFLLETNWKINGNTSGVISYQTQEHRSLKDFFGFL